MVTDSATMLETVEAQWGNLARGVIVPVGTMPLALPPGGAVIARPDRYVAAVAHDATELFAAGTALLNALR